MSSHNDRPGYGYRESRNTLTRMAAVKAGPSHIELVVSAEDLTRSEGAAFVAKLEGALADNPKVLVVNLCNTHHLSTSALGLLLRARADAVRMGIRFECRPANRDTVTLLQELGLIQILGVAA